MERPFPPSRQCRLELSGVWSVGSWEGGDGPRLGGQVCRLGSHLPHIHSVGKVSNPPQVSA